MKKPPYEFIMPLGFRFQVFFLATGYRSGNLSNSKLTLIANCLQARICCLVLFYNNCLQWTCDAPMLNHVKWRAAGSGRTLGFSCIWYRQWSVANLTSVSGECEMLFMDSTFCGEGEYKGNRLTWQFKSSKCFMNKLKADELFLNLTHFVKTWKRATNSRFSADSWNEFGQRFNKLLFLTEATHVTFFWTRQILQT